MSQIIKRCGGLVLGLALLVIVGFIVPTPEGLSVEGQKTLGICLCALCVWVCDSFPIGIGSVFAMTLIPLLGIAKYDTTLQQFMRPATFFVIATYGITCGLSETPLSARILRALVKIAGTKTNRLILAMMIATAFISTIVSNVPVTAMMMAISLSILHEMGAEPGKSRLGRTLMIAIPFAAMCGGLATPAGSSVNVIAIDLFASTTGEKITFFQWMLYGVPLTILLLPLAWFLCTRIFKPEEIPEALVENIANPKGVPPEITKREWKAIIVIIVTVFLWILGSWVDVFDMTLVATLSMVIFFLPGMDDVFTWEKFASSISWDAVFTVGSIMALGNTVMQSGLSSWLVSHLFSSAANWSTLLLFVALALIVNFIHLILPVAPSIVTMLLPPMLILAASSGYSTVAITIIIAMMAGCVQLLPVDTLTVLTYSKRYYTIGDLFKAGIMNSCAWAILIALWSYFVSTFFHA